MVIYAALNKKNNEKRGSSPQNVMGDDNLFRSFKWFSYLDLKWTEASHDFMEIY